MADGIDIALDGLVDRVRAVRRWLVSLALMRAAASGLCFVIVYVGLYSLLDHRLHLGMPGRSVAFLLFIGPLIWLVYRIVRVLSRHLSCSQAANYIESHHSFQQQLVAAIEYHENKEDYPYSQVLAHHLVKRVDAESEQLDFEETVPRWQATVCAGVIVLGLLFGTWFAVDNAAFLARYVGRLVKPVAAIAPLPPTRLEAVTKDLVAPVDEDVPVVARVEGRVPETGCLRLRSAEDTPDDERRWERAEVLSPVIQKDEGVFFQDAVRLDLGRYEYRFEAGDAQTVWHSLRVTNPPEIAEETLEVIKSPSDTIPPKPVEIKEHVAEVLAGSAVRLHVAATEDLASAKITDPYGRVHTPSIVDGRRVALDFVVHQEGFINVELTATNGLVNAKLPPIQLLLKKDELPTFALESPQGDYLATQVASVPISFKVEDDFGLESSELILEINGHTTESWPMSMAADRKSASIDNTLELEAYDLEIGDSILFYAKAQDVTTGMRGQVSPTASEVYFIEIKPYRMLWHQTAPPPPDQMKQGLTKSGHVSLLVVLEYTRALLKKTWQVSQELNVAATDGRFGALANDTQLAAEQLELIRDDARYHWSQASVGRINGVLKQYEQALFFYERSDARLAVGPLKAAYQDLRKLVQELHKTIPPAGIMPPIEGPDRLKLEEALHLARYDKDRVDWELERLANRLAEIKMEQKKLQKRFDKFLDQEEAKTQRPAVQGEESWTADEETQQGKQQNSSGGGNESPSRLTMEGALPPAPPNMSGSGAGLQGSPRRDDTDPSDERGSGDPQLSDDEQQSAQEDGQNGDPLSGEQKPGDGDKDGTGNSRSPGATGKDGSSDGASQGSGQGKQHVAGAQPNRMSRASFEERLAVLQAHQAALMARAEEIEALLARIGQQGEGNSQESRGNAPGAGEDSTSTSRDGNADRGSKSPRGTAGQQETQAAQEDARAQVKQAREWMEAFQRESAEALYADGDWAERMKEAANQLDMAADALVQAQERLENYLAKTEADQRALQLRRKAEEFSELADALDESLSAEERSRMRAYLEEAQRYLAMMPEPRNQGQAAPSGPPPTSPPGDPDGEIPPSSPTSGQQIAPVPPAGDSPATPGAGAQGNGRIGRPTGPTDAATPKYSQDGELARMIAMEFWSRAIEAQQERGGLNEQRTSNVEFYDLENAFFRKAAEYHDGVSALQNR